MIKSDLLGIYKNFEEGVENLDICCMRKLLPRDIAVQDIVTQEFNGLKD